MISHRIQDICSRSIEQLLGDDASFAVPVINRTRKEFEGDYTLVVFPYVRQFKKSPEQVADLIGQQLIADSDWLESYNVVKGFLNIKIKEDQWHGYLKDWQLSDQLDLIAPKPKVMVEFCSPNTNKPIHLGHMRNILLGWSLSRILEAAGHEVLKTQIINDRGIAICKSMWAWKNFGEGRTPESTGTKGDFFVGDYYVLFEQKFQEEYRAWQVEAGESIFTEKGKENESREDFFKRYKHEYFNRFSGIGSQAQEMLRAWEAKEPEVYDLWQKMNGWVYDGFAVTYDLLQIGFDHMYYESDTYIKGRDMVRDGLSKGVFYQKEDGSIWCDLTDIGMDHKILLRADGTALYITQDLGTAEQRYEDYNISGGVYVVGNEQDYHFQVLFELLKRLEAPYAEGLKHLSYGMVELPSGKMKSREGNVVDADDLVAEIIGEATKNSQERGELEGLTGEEVAEINRKVGLGALKFFILKVNPKKGMVYDPKESLDMQGQTGPYIQNAYVRIASVLRKSEEMKLDEHYVQPSELEKGLFKDLIEYPSVIETAAKEMDPSHIANYAYNLAKDYHRFYHDHRILTAETEEAKRYRLQLSKTVKEVLAHSMDLLGIEMPEKM